MKFWTYRIIINTRWLLFQTSETGWVMFVGGQRLIITYHRKTDDPN